MEITELFIAIANRFNEKMGFYPSRTKLLKLSYLAEIFYKRLTGKRLTEVKWIFWKYGPYIPEYDKIISSNAFEGVESQDDFKIVIPIDKNITDYVYDINSSLTGVEEFFDMELNDLLDFVYFDTEPMIHVNKRGEELDFEKVKPEEFYKVKKLKISKERGNLIRKRIKEWEDNNARSSK